MKFYQEVTDWSDNTPNHVYLLDDSKSKMFAYVKSGTKSVFEFKTPIPISTRGRKFVPVANTYKFTFPVAAQEQSSNPKWEVLGSKGDKYIVEKTSTGLTCTCTGFKYRSQCKHLTVAK